MPHDLRGPTEEEQLQFLKEMAKQARYGGAADVTPDIAGLGLGAKALGPLNSLIMGLMGQSTGAQADPNTQPLDLGLLSQAVVPGPVKLARAAMTKGLKTGKSPIQLVPPFLWGDVPFPKRKDVLKTINAVMDSIPRAELEVRGRGPKQLLGRYGYRNTKDLDKAPYLETDVYEMPYRESPGKTGPRTLGPKAVREVLKYLATAYPQAQELGGSRVSGVRAAMDVKGPAINASYNLNRLAPENEAEALKILQNASQYLQKRISSGEKVTSAPLERDLIRKFLGLKQRVSQPIDRTNLLGELNPTPPANLGEATIDPDNLFEALGHALGLPR